MEDRIDILLATYNGEKYLKQQLDSIINQTYKNIKIIVSDDASSDSTVQILKEYQQKDNRIELHIQEKNLGIVKNIEFLLNKVESPYFMLSDQDDVWMQEKIGKSIEYLKKQNADFLFTDLEVVDENLNTMYKSFNDYMLLTRKINKYLNDKRLNYLYNCVTGCTILAKKETIQCVLPLPTYSKYLIHDHWMSLMISLNFKVTYFPEKYIKYRQHGNNQVGTEKISHGFSKLEQVRELFLNVKKGVFGTYVENNNRFPKDIQTTNLKAFDYFNMLENKKVINFKGWSIFHTLYKTETFIYYIENFLILNMPLFAKGLFNIRHFLLKLQGKR